MTFKGKIRKHKSESANGTKYTAYDLVLSKKKKFKSKWCGKTVEKRIMINRSELPSKYKKLLSKKGKVKVTGKLMIGETGWYCEKYAIMAKKITLA